jgi:sulfite reductase (ferredoxin)
VIENDVKGFRMLLGGGIGAQPRTADVLFDFIPAEQIIPMSEAIIRVFDRYGERVKRNKARLKFLIKEVGLEQFMQWVNLELNNQCAPLLDESDVAYFPQPNLFALSNPTDLLFEKWYKTNVFKQKQSGLFAVGIPIGNGNISSQTARILADIIKIYAGDDSRFTVSQSILLRHIPEENISALYKALKEIGLATPGFERINDITACPGTDTCNLGIGSSMGLASELKRVIEEEFEDLITDYQLTIKISGCMNACGQHTIANIGFQGMTIQKGNQIAPATQVLLGGGLLGNGFGRFADKLLKVPSRKVPDVLRWILNDFSTQHLENENFNEYYDRKTADYFFQHLKSFADTSQLTPIDFIDWGNETKYEKAIGVGECAGVMIDLIQTLIFEADEMYEWAENSLKEGKPGDAIYHAYAAQIRAAKALLTAKNVSVNSHESIIKAFDTHFPDFNTEFGTSFEAIIDKNRTDVLTFLFAEKYLDTASNAIKWIKNQRNEQVN